MELPHGGHGLTTAFVRVADRMEQPPDNFRGDTGSWHLLRHRISTDKHLLTP